MHPMRTLMMACCAAMLAGCAATPKRSTDADVLQGTAEPWAAESIYFVITDRFVNGDGSNDQRRQGGEHRTFDIPLPPCDGMSANIGYMGGDFAGLLGHGNYIRSMGFTAVWITPIVANPDEAFTGGDEITCTSFLSDRGKAGYHGYWATSFHEIDEHWPSEGLGFAELTAGLKEKGLKTVLDIVGNHTSPGYTMPEKQPGYGQLFDAKGTLVADHQNLPPEQLDPANPLHAFYNTQKDLAQLADLNADNPAVMDLLVDAYSGWIDQGADAFRVDTIRHQPLAFWKTFADRIRKKHPGFFMFGEAFDYDAANIAPFTQPQNGGYSVLDFPLRQALVDVFGEKQMGFERIAEALYLEGGPYHNVYELMTFYDNHDMPRMQATNEGFIDAHNWLFTARGIPVIYYGSEMGFSRGRAEHAGNRNYYGPHNIALAQSHPIFPKLTSIAQVRKQSTALQRGVQWNVQLEGDHAVFYRVFETADDGEIALVMLNKSDQPHNFVIDQHLQSGSWREALTGREVQLMPRAPLIDTVPAHGVSVWLRKGRIEDPEWAAALRARMPKD